MQRLICFFLIAGPAIAQSDSAAPPAGDLAAERQQALDYLKHAQCHRALPLLKEVITARPNDADALAWTGYCLFTESGTAATPAQAETLRDGAHKAALRARQLGSKWILLNDLIITLETPTAPQSYSQSAEANAKMKEGETAFSKGDYPGSLAAYGAALKLDPKLYEAALFSGDVCYRTKDIACAADWFSKAVAIAPARETAYRYWGDALMASGKMMEAREKFIEAVIAEPSQKPWNALINWAKRNNCQLTAPKIERPPVSDSPPKIGLLDAQNAEGTGRDAWASYGIVRAAWRESLFAKTYSDEKQYRRSLAEETAALNAVADAVGREQTPHLDPQLANLIALRNDGLLECWILLSGGADPGIARDYPAYRDAHHLEMRAYFDKYIIHPIAAPPAPK